MATIDAAYSPRHFRWALNGSVGIVTLSRPERKNPLTFESYAELRDLFRALANAHRREGDRDHRRRAEISAPAAMCTTSSVRSRRWT